MTDALFMKYLVIGLVGLVAVIIYFNFRILSYYIKQIGKLENKYTSLAEMRDTTKIEDVMTTLERDIKAQNYRHEQEMMSAFNTLKSYVEKFVPGYNTQPNQRNKSNKTDVELF